MDYNLVSAMLSGHTLRALLDDLNPARYTAAVVFNQFCDAEKATILSIAESL